MTKTFSPLESENSGALAGATGADFDTSESLEYYRRRHLQATQLCHAIAACHPQDACVLMVAGLEDLSAGTPPPTIRKAMAEARDWARVATIYELRAYAAAIVEVMPAADRSELAAFIAAQLQDGSKAVAS